MNGTYDNALICLNGHIITDSIKKNPQKKEKYCKICGAETIYSCPNCKNAIKGGYNDTLDYFYGYERPNYCEYCGKPFPWIYAAFEAAFKLSNEIESISDDEKKDLMESIENLVSDTPKTPLAINRYKKIMTKAGKDVAVVFNKILIELVSETVKKILFP